MKMQVGDIVIPSQEASERYGLTIENWVGEVIKVNGGGSIVVQTIKPNDPAHDHIGDTYPVSSRYFIVKKDADVPCVSKNGFSVGDVVVANGKGAYTYLIGDWVGYVSKIYPGGEVIKVTIIDPPGEVQTFNPPIVTRDKYVRIAGEDTPVEK